MGRAARTFVGVACVVTLGACQTGGADEGAVGFKVADAHGWIVETEPETAFTDGLEVLYPTEPVSFTITDVRLLPSDSGLELVGASILGPDDRSLGATQWAASYPPAPEDVSATTDALPDAIGYRVDAADIADLMQNPNDADGNPRMDGYELLIGIEAPEAGKFERTSIAVDYESSRGTGTLAIDAGLVVCSGVPKATDFDCES